MKQYYFVVVLAHSLQGRLRRTHIPHEALYVVLALALLGGFSLFGMVYSYLRMTWKVANYNSLRDQVNILRTRYQELQRQNEEKGEQLASLQLMAAEVSVAFGLQNQVRGANDIAQEGRLGPSFQEPLEEHNFLNPASFSPFHHDSAHTWLKKVVPTKRPGNGGLRGPVDARQ